MEMDRSLTCKCSCNLQIVAAALIFAALLVLLPMAPAGFTDDISSQSNLFL